MRQFHEVVIFADIYPDETSACSYNVRANISFHEDLVLAMIVVLVLVNGIIIATIISLSMIYVKKNTKTSNNDHTSAPSSVEPSDVMSRLNAMQDHNNAYRNWQETLRQVMQVSYSEPVRIQMLQQIAQICTQMFEDSFCIIALSPIEEIVSMMPEEDTFLTKHIRADEIISVPQIDKHVLRIINQQIIHNLQIWSTRKKHWISLQQFLISEKVWSSSNVHTKGIVVPLRLRNITIGYTLLLNQKIAERDDIAKIHGVNLSLIGLEIISIIRYLSKVEPVQQIKNNDSKQHTPEFRKFEDQKIMMRELSAYSQFAMLRATDLPHLAKQTSVSLLHICKADCVAFLKKDESGEFAMESLEMKQYSWSRHLRKSDVPLPRPFDRHTLNNWPDLFVQISCEAGRSMNLNSSNGLNTIAPKFNELGLQSMFVRPVLVEGKCKAILVVGNFQNQGFSDQTEAIITSVAAMAAMSMKGTVELQQHKTFKIPKSIFHISEVMRTHECLCEQHTENIVELSSGLADLIGCSGSERWNIRMAATVCDIGMTMIPNSILMKKSQLSNGEIALIQQHPILGESMLKGYPECQDFLPLVRHHHERWDGSGYPDHLKGEEIPLGARIIAVADTYLSMQREQPYRQSISSTEAINEIGKLSETLFDPAVVEVLQTFIAKKQAA